MEKPKGFEESQLTSWLIWVLMNHVEPRNLGLITSPDGPFRLQPGLVRLPDIAYVDKRRFPGGKLPRGGIANVVPNLAVEVLSAGNTQVEMRSKLQEYFRAGVEVVWFIDHRKRTCEVFTSPHDRTVLNQDQSLTGGAVLPGFELSLQELFSRLDDH